MELKHPTTKIAGALAIACTIWISGCSPKFVIHVDGYPSPEEVEAVWSNDGSITAKWFFSRWFLKTFESGGFSEEIAYPEHLLFEGRNDLPADTSNVVINLQVYNPRMKKYRLVRCLRVGGEAVEEGIGAWTIREVQHVLVPGPAVAGREIGLSAKIMFKEDAGSGEQVLSTGELTYMIEPSERDAPRGK